MSSIQYAIDELHVAFKKLNEVFFRNELPEPALTIQSSGKRLSMGWCTTKEVWHDREGKVRKYEINISAEFLIIEFLEMMNTLLHEMVHLYNIVNGVKDCSRNGTYHNKKFKAECERRGFYFANDKPDQRYGWTDALLTEEAKAKILHLGIKSEAFSIARGNKTVGGAGESEEEGEKKQTTFRWVCPTCQLIVRSTKESIHLICGECNEKMVHEKKEEVV